MEILLLFNVCTESKAKEALGLAKYAFVSYKWEETSRSSPKTKHLNSILLLIEAPTVAKGSLNPECGAPSEAELLTLKCIALKRSGKLTKGYTWFIVVDLQQDDIIISHTGPKIPIMCGRRLDLKGLLCIMRIYNVHGYEVSPFNSLKRAHSKRIALHDRN
jgi:hypothetical protein